jgi:hypothetical protein
MEPDKRIQLNIQLQKILDFERKNAPDRTKYWGYFGELLVGIMILGQIVLKQHIELSIQIEWILFTLSMLLIVHSIYLIVIYDINKKMRLIIESLLSTDNQETTKSSL